MTLFLSLKTNNKLASGTEMKITNTNQNIGKINKILFISFRSQCLLKQNSFF